MVSEDHPFHRTSQATARTARGLPQRFARALGGVETSALSHQMKHGLI